MGAEIIQAAYDQLAAIGEQFGQRAEATTELHRRIEQGVQALENGGWEGLGAEAFQAEMRGEVFPAIVRLTQALAEGRSVTLEAIALIQQAEEEAAAVYNQDPFGALGSGGSGGAGLQSALGSLSAANDNEVLAAVDMEQRYKERLEASVAHARSQGGDINYGEIDELGRPLGIEATITPGMILTGTDASSSIRPPGFDSLPLGNRARGHLLGNQLGGLGNIPHNLVAIYQVPTNVPGMVVLENQIRDAVEAGETVKYKVTPIYDGDNPLPTHIHMQAEGDRGLYFDEMIPNAPKPKEPLASWQSTLESLRMFTGGR